MTRLGAWVGVFAAMAATAVASDRDFHLEAEPLFRGTECPPKVQPFLITVENRGPDARGVIQVTAGEFSMRYPIDLPQGSRKRLVAYVTAGYYLEGMVTLNTPRGGGQFRLEASVLNSGVCIVGVSDAEGELGFVRSQNGPRGQVADLYVSPDLMPDRTAAYAGVSAVYLSDGSERMNDAAVAALKGYVLSGGTLVVTGGASMPLMGDPRLRSLLPVVDAVPKTMSLPGTLFGMVTTGEPVTLGVGTVAPSTRVLSSVRDIPFAVERKHGLGRVLYLALNVTEGPSKGWQGRQNLFNTLNVMSLNSGFPLLVDLTALQGRQDYGYSGYAVPPPRTMPGSYYPGAIQERDPFKAKVPDTSTVVGILLLYLVLVVPVNLLVLRKLGKGEMAWITSPIISLAFAAVFFRFSASLYAADLSAATSGVLVGHQGEPSGFFLGRSQMFFPRGGRYDLKLSGVEAVFGVESSRNGQQASTLDQLAAIDTGEIIAPEAAVTNLSFREFSLIQRVQMASWFSVTPQLEGGKIVGAKVTNASPHSLVDAGVLVQGKTFSLETIGPGQTKSTGRAPFRAMDPLVDVAQRSVAGGGGCLVGILDGFRGGPQIGAVATSSNRTWLIFTFGGGTYR